MIKHFYNFLDFILLLIIKLSVNHDNVKKVLESEIVEYATKETTNAFLIHAEMINSRVSVLIGHVSIMLAVLLYSLSIYSRGSFQSYVALIEVSLYLFVAIICLRCLKAYGFELKVTDNNYKQELFDDLVLRYSAHRFSNFLTILLTIAFIVLVVVYPPIKLTG